MFSGLTNQVSSWIGAAKGEPQDEEVPVADGNAPATSAAPLSENIQLPEETPVDLNEDSGDKKLR